MAMLAALGVAGCGGSSSSSPVMPTSPTTGGPTMTISAGSGVSPKEVTVPPGTRVLFVNRDVRSRQMSSDPHPSHEDCPEINQVGFLRPNETKETGNLNTVRTCGFHDHDDPGNAAVHGRIIVR